MDVHEGTQISDRLNIIDAKTQSLVDNVPKLESLEGEMTELVAPIADELQTIHGLVRQTSERLTDLGAKIAYVKIETNCRTQPVGANQQSQDHDNQQNSGFSFSTLSKTIDNPK